MVEILLASIEDLKSGEVGKLVDSRMKEFKKLGRKTDNDIFSELCFCILTANFNAERSIRIQDEIGDGFCGMSEPELATKLKSLGHRFPNVRAKYIAEARKHKNHLKQKIDNFESQTELRNWAASNIKGIGHKEASHFLRNIGFTDVAIIDFHIIDVLVKHVLIKRPKTLTPKKYLEIESVLKRLAEKVDMNLAELDLYLWYMETGKVLK